MAPLAYTTEVLTIPMLPATALLAIDPGTRSTVFAGSILLTLSFLALRTERLLGVRRNPLTYPALELMRGLTVAALWPVPFVSSTVSWRGNRFRIRKRTLLEPVVDDSRQQAA
jgi:hypothetical protein